MATDTNSLMADAKCYVCLAPGQWPLVALGLLRQLLLAQNPMADTSVNTLMEQAKCYQCLTPGMWPLIALALLKQIAETGGGGGGSGSVLCGDANPVADPGINCAIYYRRDTGNMWWWNDTTTAWDPIL